MIYVGKRFVWWLRVDVQGSVIYDFIFFIFKIDYIIFFRGVGNVVGVFSFYFIFGFSIVYGIIGRRLNKRDLVFYKTIKF